MCPPVREQTSMRRLAHLVGERAEARRATSARRSAGDWMRSRSDMVAEIYEAARDDENVREPLEVPVLELSPTRAGRRSPPGPRVPPRWLARASTPSSGRVGALRQSAGPGRPVFPSCIGRRRDVQHVVGDLECQADGVAVAVAAPRPVARRRRRRAPDHRPTRRSARRSSTWWIRSSSSSVSVLPSPCRSSSCPPIMPPAPTRASAPRTIARRRRPGSPSALAARQRSARQRHHGRRPATVAVGTSKARCAVARPRRMSSSSMHGRSSCTSEYACTTSTAAASALASPVPPAASYDASSSSPRSRFPSPRRL